MERGGDWRLQVVNHDIHSLPLYGPLSLLAGVVVGVDVVGLKTLCEGRRRHRLRSKAWFHPAFLKGVLPCRESDL